VCDQAAHDVFLAQGAGGEQGSGAACVACFRIDAGFEQGGHQTRPVAPDREQQGRTAVRRRRKDISPARDQVECERLALRGIRGLDGRREVARQPAASADRGAAFQQLANRARRGRSARQEPHRKAIAALVRRDRFAGRQQQAQRGGVQLRGELQQQRGDLVVLAGQQGQQLAHVIVAARGQRHAQACQRRRVGQFFAGIGDAGWQRIVWIEPRHQGPAAGRDGIVERGASIATGAARIDAQRQQLFDALAIAATGLAGDRQCVAPGVVAGTGIGPVCGERAQGLDAAGARGFQQGRDPEFVARIGIRAQFQQGAHDLGVSGQASGVQGAAIEPAARIHARLVLEQQADAGGVVFPAGGGKQRRLSALGFRPGTALEQEFRHTPVAIGAGHAERAPAVAVDRVERRIRIEQQCRHRRVDAECGSMQGAASFGVGQAWIGAVGQEGHHRFGSAMPAVARGGEQRRQAGMGAIHVHAGRDQGAQQAQVAEQGGQYR
jgi:hypothetical protein